VSELCLQLGNKPLARDAALKIADEDEKIPILVKLDCWQEAVQVAFKEADKSRLPYWLN
jgi:hypothetical protein